MKCLTIVYRDLIGPIASMVDERYGISFCDGEVYFTDALSGDKKISADSLLEITMADWEEESI